ncbi:MAG TPA: NfeD family protein, partial [Solirubrobacterales bacterium]
GPKAGTLDTEGLVVEERDMPLQYDILQLLVNPNIAYLLLIAGVLGLAVELLSPGLIFPGSIGLLSLLLGLYGTAQLPVTAAGILLLVLGVGMIVAEAHLPTSGILGGLGVVALAVAGLLLFDTDSEGFGISVPLVLGIAIFFGGGLAIVVSKVVEARRNPVYTGQEELVGREGVVRVALDPVGQAFVEGALWRAELVDPDLAPVVTGVRVRVESVDGLTLMVRPIADDEEAATPPREGET